MVALATPETLYEVVDGRMVFRPHRGQIRAWDSVRRFVVVMAGAQSGKTAFGPVWLRREISLRGPGDYLAVTSSYDLFKLKMLPALREVFEHMLRCGRYWSGDRVIELADPLTGQFRAKRADDPMWGRIILRSAESDSGLEATTAKGAWLDEVGQDAFALEAWEAILRRLSLAQGRALLTTTLYNFGWLKTNVYDPWTKGNPNFEVISFDSTANPLFPPQEMERARESMPRWRFDMQYRGVFTRPAGLIYDSFDEARAIIPRFTLPASWPRHLGLDFGGVNTAGLFYAAEPNTQNLYLYREYKAGGRTAAEHAIALKSGEPMIPQCTGGSMSEGQWRKEFQAAGLPVQEPTTKDVEVGISRVYGAHKRAEIRVFDDLAGYLAEKRSYARKLDSAGQPTEVIEDKSTYHFLDAERYIIGRLREPPKGISISGVLARPAPALPIGY